LARPVRQRRPTVARCARRGKGNRQPDSGASVGDGLGRQVGVNQLELFQRRAQVFDNFGGQDIRFWKVGAVLQGVVAQDVAVVPELLDDPWEPSCATGGILH
jgi:hypothetical protein